MAEIYSPTPQKNRSYKRIGIAVFAIVLLVMIAYLLLPQKSKNVLRRLMLFTAEENAAANRGLFRVGEETIYQKDLDTELMYHPLKDKPETKTVLIQKMITDSKILQAAADDKYIQLDESIYNSPDKDYFKRIKAVEDIKKKIEQERNNIEGFIISIWFYNNNDIGSLGYEGGKLFAREKMTQLHTRIINGDITIEEAGDLIKQDESLLQVDEAYESNAIATFDTAINEQISFSPEFDAVLKNLKPGQISDVTVVKDKEEETGLMRDAVYMVGQVTKKTTNKQINSFDDWFNKKKTSYEIKYL